MAAPRKKILLVDDTATVRILERAILGADFEYLEGKNGAEGVELATTHRPDLVLLDLNMPILDGVDALRQLKHDQLTRHIPVIIVTSEGDLAKKDRCRALGCSDFLAKPIDGMMLKEAVRRHLH